MAKDICNSDVSLTTADALEDWNAMVLAFLAHGTDTPVRLNAVLEREPDFAMGHAARGLFSIMMGRRELMETARTALVVRYYPTNGMTIFHTTFRIDSNRLTGITLPV